MHKRILTLLTILSLSTALLIGCGSTQETPTQSESTTTETVEVSDGTTEETTTDTTEELVSEASEEPASEPSEEPASEPSEEPASEPSEEPVSEPQVMYTYTDMSATMYATQTVNVRDLPSTDGEKIGSLSLNQEITVLAQCNETSWYKFDYNGQTAFVSNKYVSTEKVEVAPPADTNNTTTTECPYPLNQIVDEGGDRVCFFFVGSMNDYVNMTYDCASIIAERHGWTTNWNGRTGGNAGMYGTYAETNYTYNGQKVYQARPATYLIGPNGGGPANATETVICPIF